MKCFFYIFFLKQYGKFQRKELQVSFSCIFKHPNIQHISEEDVSGKGTEAYLGFCQISIIKVF